MVGGGPVQVPPLPGQAENGPVIRQQGTALPPQGAANGTSVQNWKNQLAFLKNA